jgi:Ca2+-transporting ATPase
MNRRDNTTESGGGGSIGTAPAVENAWTLDPARVCERLSIDPERGLSSSEARARLRRYGKNAIRQKDKRSARDILVDQAKSFIIVLLAVAAVLALVVGQWLESVAIVIAIAANVLIGFFSELKALRSMEALSRMSKATARVRRGGELGDVPSDELVPGDLIELEGGDMVPADARVVEASHLQINESAMTGESVPVMKSTEQVEQGTPLADRHGMLYKGTAVTSGSGKAVIVATGMGTELGHISTMAQEAEPEEETPLERRLNMLGRKLVWLTLAVAAAVGISGFAAGRDIFLMVETAIALAVAAIPEGLPVVAAIALARGMWRMARRNALINRLSAVETLGTASVICCDKTGTLTENHMSLVQMRLAGGADAPAIRVPMSEKGVEEEGGAARDDAVHERVREVLKAAMLCTNAEIESDDREVGDPLEVALIRGGMAVGLDKDRLREQYPELREEAFDTGTKMMATFHRDEDGGIFVSVKGAPERVIEASTALIGTSASTPMSDELREAWLKENRRMAEEGLRILALAVKRVKSEEDDPYEGLNFTGLAGLLDPPRKGTKPLVESSARAGVRTIMVTGDHPGTALAIAKAAGIAPEEAQAGSVGTGAEASESAANGREAIERTLNRRLFARVSPEQKLDIVELLQRNGGVVAMTGDGVNDAPALRKADIGIAMGRRGTEVAKEASDMVLRDDSFASIVTAIELGRTIYNNIRKFVMYLLSGNAAEIIAVGIAIQARAQLPLLPLQILYLNMLSDVFPALALGVGPDDPTVMNKPPRRKGESLLTVRNWIETFLYGVLIAAIVLWAFWWGADWAEARGVHVSTVSFPALALARLWHVFNMRDWGSRLLTNNVVRNLWVWGAIALCAILIVAAVYVPWLARALRLGQPSPGVWVAIVVFSLAPTVIVQSAKELYRLWSEHTGKGAR